MPKLSTYPAVVQGKTCAEIWSKHNRHFRIAKYSQPPDRLIPDAWEFLLDVRVRAINTIPMAEAAISTPVLLSSDIYRERIATLERLEEEWIEFSGRARARLGQFARDFLAIQNRTYPELFDRVCDRRNISRDPVLGVMQSSSYNAQTWIDAGISEMGTAIRAVKTANRLMLGH